MLQIDDLSFCLKKTSKRQDFPMAERETQQILLQKEKKNETGHDYFKKQQQSQGSNKPKVHNKLRSDYS